MELYNTAKAIGVATIAMGVAAKDVQNEMHKIACSVLVHYAKHNDKRVVANLLTAMPESARVNAMRDWFNQFGTMAIGAKDEIVTAPGKKLKLADAIKTPFWKLSPEKAYVPIDVVGAINALVKKLERDAKETALDHSAQINALTAIASQYVAPAPNTDKDLTKPQAIKLSKALAGQITAEPEPMPA